MLGSIRRTAAVAAAGVALLSAASLPALAVVSYRGPIGGPLHADPGRDYAPVFRSYALMPRFGPILVEPSLVHVAWCLSRYQSYDPASDTYLGQDGERYLCISPY
jgi:hypothetical protein